MPAPIVIFAFNRPKEFSSLLESLRKNPLYEESDKFIFIDGPRNDRDAELINEVKKLAINETDLVFPSVSNKGLGESIIAGVSKVLKKYGKAIVLEDDLIVMPGFLLYMNECLDAFESDKRIISICGYSLKIKLPEDYKSNIYLGDRASSWGWGTWSDRWERVDWKVSDWNDFSADKQAIRNFNRAGSDLYSMLSDYMNGKNKSWAIRFCYSQFRNGLWSLHPVKSLVDNNGFGETATNCRQKYNRFKVELDTLPPRLTFFANHNNKLKPDQNILRQLHRYHSIPIRIYSLARKILRI